LPGRLPQALYQNLQRLGERHTTATTPHNPQQKEISGACVDSNGIRHKKTETKKKEFVAWKKIKKKETNKKCLREL
jgi:hypothetical protein